MAQENISEPEILVASLSHEVAHAWRMFHGLAVDDRDEEELLTDLTTVYLGFGILTTNGSSRYRTSGEFDGAYVTYRCSLQRTGYLPHYHMSFLLAVQAVARGMGWCKRRRIAGLLETDQAYYFRRSVKCLNRSRDLKMRFPMIATTRNLPDLQPMHQPVRLSLPDKPMEEVSDIPRLNEGGYVYRVKRNKKVPYGFWGTVGGVLVGLASEYMMGFGWQAMVSGGIFGVVVFGFMGAYRPWDYCSDFECQSVIPVNASECPRCGGAVCGTLSHPNEQLDLSEE